MAPGTDGRRANGPARLAPLAPAAAAAAVYAALAIRRHDRFGSGGYDLGIFDQAVWGYSHFELIPNTVKRVPNLLGDHFHPILAALAPLYWIWSDPRMLLLVQAVLLALGSVPVAWWAREQLGRGAALGFQLAYLLFWAVLAGDLFDFHEVAVAVPAISFGLYGALMRRDRLLVATAVAGGLTKEDVPLTFLAIGLYVAVVQRRRIGIVVAAACAAWTALLVVVVMPALAGGAYGYWRYGEVLRRPWETISLLVDPPRKLVTLVELLGSWLFLPLLSPLVLVALPAVAERFWTPYPGVWGTRYHYSLVLAPVLAFAAVDAAAHLRERVTARVAAPAVALAALVVAAAFVHPLRALDDTVSATRAAAIGACLATIPPDASVAATGTLIPHLSQRRRIYPFADRGGQEYLAIGLDDDTRRLAPSSAAAATAQAVDAGYRRTCFRPGAVLVLTRPGTLAGSPVASARAP